MPNIRFKVEGTGKPATRVEIALDETFDAGVRTLLNAASLQAHPDTWLSLNKEVRPCVCTQRPSMMLSCKLQILPCL